MDFRRRSLRRRDGAGEVLPDRCHGGGDAPWLFPSRNCVPPVLTMKTRGDSQSEMSDVFVGDNAALHAELRDVPLPVGYMYRLRELVYHRLDSADSHGGG
jgi:hypothetical protein